MDDPLVLHDLRPSRADAMKNRELLLETASRLFAARGVEAVSMSTIAEEAGVGKGTLYRHFSNKNELCLALLDHEQRDLQEKTLARLRGNRDCSDNLKWFLAAAADFIWRALPLMLNGTAESGLPSLAHPAHIWFRQTIRGLLAQMSLQVDLDYAADTLYVMLDAHVIAFQQQTHGAELPSIVAGLHALVDSLTRS
ncbi:MAG: TetR/AcrR family transcriptional regulator [Anaerolineae bacterium]